MRLLLDTHIVLWALIEDPRLSEHARKLIEDFSNELYVSVVSLWEVQLKHDIHPEAMEVDAGFLEEVLEEFDYRALELGPADVIALETLERDPEAPPHADPFDRLLLAQAKARGMRFVTHDARFGGYGEDCVELV